MEFKQVVYAIMTLVIILFGLALIYNFDSPLVKQILGTEVPGANQKPSEGITPFKQFVKEYKECSTLPDTNCICPLTTFSLPKNTFIEIENFGKLASFNYFEGSIKSRLNDVITPNYGPIIEGCKPKPNLKLGEEQKGCTEDSDYTIKHGSILIPNSYFTNYFLTKCIEYSDNPTKTSVRSLGGVLEGNKQCIKEELVFDTSRYTTDSMIFLSSDGAGSTPIKVYTTANIKGYNEFNFEGIYKKDNSLYLMDSSYTSLIDTFGKSGRLTKVDELYAKLKACKKPEGYSEAKAVYDSILEKSESCSKDKVIAPLFCDTIKSILPQKFQILISKANLQLIYENSIIFSSDKPKFELISDPQSGKFQELSGILTINPIDQNEKDKVIQLDFYKCPNNMVCIRPITETSRYASA
jgi:pentatricopeptide repeat protein